MIAVLLLITATLPAARTAAETRLATLDRAARTQENRLAAEQAPLAQLLATAQRLALRPPALALARPQAIDDMVRTRALIAALAPQIRARTAKLRAAMLRTEALRAETEQALAMMMEARTSTRSAQASAITARLAALPSPVMRASFGKPGGAYRLPAPGTVIVGMGERSDIGVRARGLTLATLPGASVAAPASGRIAYAGPFRGYGDIVILDHGHGWTTVLAGLALVTASGGALMGAGEPLGQMARIDPRLTIELHHNGRPIDVAAIVLQ